ncbi:MAG: hypothetical protein RL166_701 [Actinomycetota bacterium]
MIRKTSLIALVSALSLALSGCAELPAPAPISEVNYRACLVTEGATDAMGVNEVADYGIKQAVATYGVKRTVQKSSPAKLATNVEKLHKLGCNLFVLSGEGFSTYIDEIVMTRPETNFVYLAESAQPALIRADRDNLAIYQIDMYEAGLLTGHLAASMSELKTVAILCEQPGRETFIEGLRDGVERFGADNAVVVDFNLGPAATTSSMRVMIGCKGELEINGVGYTVLTRATGFGRDLYFNNVLGERNKFVAATLIPQIAPRILEVIASDLEGDFIGGSLGSAVASYGNGGLKVSPEHDVPFPSNELQQLEQLALDYEITLK